MGVLYSIIPLSSDMHEWLDEQGVSYSVDQTGRLPTPRELLETASELEGIVIELYGGDDFSQIDMHSTDEEGPYTLLNVRKRTGDDDPAEFYFEKGWPELIIQFLITLAYRTGPMMLLPDTGEKAIIISEDSAIEQVTEEWEHTNPELYTIE